MALTLSPRVASSRGSVQTSRRSLRPRIDTSECCSKSAQTYPAPARVGASIAIVAFSSRVSDWSRDARLVVLPTALQIHRSAARMLPTKAGPVAIPTPTAGDAQRVHDVPSGFHRRALLVRSGGRAETAIIPSPLNSTMAPP